MPLLDNAEDIRSHLRTALESRTWWVLVADSKRGHDNLLALGRQLYDRIGDAWVESCDFGRTAFTILHRRVVEISFMLVPKSIATVEVGALLGEGTDQCVRRDVLLLLEDHTADEVEPFLWAAELGRLSPDPSAN